MKKYSLHEIVQVAKSKSSYFAESLKALDPQKFKNEKELLRALPLTDHTHYWNSHQFKNNPLLTESEAHGILFKSGGSTGHPKFSYFTSEEWKSFCEIFGWGISQGLLSAGDRVGNLFYAGDLYASFIFIKDSFENISDEILQLPLGGFLSDEVLAQELEYFQLTALCGVPTSILKSIQIISEKNPQALKNLKKILYGGESMYADQIEGLKRLIPDLQVASVGYASVDAGLLGYYTKDCAIDEHRVFDGYTLMEILDEESLQPIDEKLKPGVLYVTNLTRKLMPILRYPSGDRAQWVEDPSSSHRKFKILGRNEEGARVGTVTVHFEEVREILEQVFHGRGGFQFQLLLQHHSHKDQLILRLCELTHHDKPGLENQIISLFYKQKPSFEETVQKKLIHPLKFEWAEIDQFEQNPRTGKLRRLVDHRRS